MGGLVNEMQVINRGRLGPRQDYHVHSTHSVDASSNIHVHCVRALELELTEIGFTEHFELDPRDEGFGFFDPERYMGDIGDARERFGSGINIRAGVEITYLPSLEQEIRGVLDRYAFDFVIGSVHILEDADGWAVISSERGSKDWFANRDEDSAYCRYFETVLDMVNSGLFDILGHLDIMKRYGVPHYGPFRWENHKRRIEAILKAVAAQGMALEVNTSGLRQSPVAPFPEPAILRRFRELGGTLVTTGSDAHNTGQLGLGLERANSWLLQSGFEMLTGFEQRCPFPTMLHRLNDIFREVGQRDGILS